MRCLLLPHCFTSSLRSMRDAQHAQQQLPRGGCAAILEPPANPWKFQSKCGMGLRTQAQNRIASAWSPAPPLTSYLIWRIITVSISRTVEIQQMDMGKAFRRVPSTLWVLDKCEQIKSSSSEEVGMEPKVLSVGISLLVPLQEAQPPSWLFF